MFYFLYRPLFKVKDIYLDTITLWLNVKDEYKSSCYFFSASVVLFACRIFPRPCEWPGRKTFWESATIPVIKRDKKSVVWSRSVAAYPQTQHGRQQHKWGNFKLLQFCNFWLTLSWKVLWSISYIIVVLS